MRSRSIALAVIVGLIAWSAHAAEPAWEFAEEKDGVKVYTRPIPGVEFREFKGVAVIEAPIEVLGTVLRDIESFPQWFADCKHTRIIEKIDDNTFIFLFVQGAPWPVSDRDVVLKASTRVDWHGGRAVVDLVSMDDPRQPPTKERVRLRSMTGHFVFEYQTRNRTKVSYSIKADPSGSLPAALANSTTRKYPLDTLKGMRRMATMAKYREAAVASSDARAIDQLVAEGVLKP